MLTSGVVVSGPQSVMEPTMPGATTIAHVSISLPMSSFGDSGTVGWATEAVAGGATPGDDFTVSSGTASLSFMNPQFYVDIPIKYDTVSESPEAFKVVLSSATGNLVIMVGTATINITDNNPPPPPPPPPGVPTVNFSAPASNFMLEGQNKEIHVVRDLSADWLTVYYVIADDSVATSGDVGLAPAGSVQFIPGQTDATITLTAIDDSDIEVHELLKLSLVQYPAPNQGPGAYMVGSTGDSNTIIGDNEEDVFSDLTVDWKTPDGGWQNSPDTEMLWQDDELRWTATLPPEEMPFAAEMTSLTLLKRPHDNPAASWEAFSSQPVQQNPNNLAQFFITANPLVGDWDITVHGVFGAAINAWLVAPKHRPAENVTSVKWEKPQNNQGLRLDYSGPIPQSSPYYGPRIFPEYNLPPDHVQNQNDNSTVDVKVTLSFPVPAGFVADLYLKDFDVDNAFNATSADNVGNGFLDPNDDIVDNPNYPDAALFPIGTDNSKTVRHKPGDNRDGFGGYEIGGYLENDHIEFAASSSTQTAGYTIYYPQPGNNYRVGVSGHQAYVNRFVLAKDGITIALANLSNPSNLSLAQNVPANRVSDTLTIWRTLHIERDSMGPPPSTEVFDTTQPKDDKPPTPSDIRDADISMMAPWFLPADIEVVADLTTYDVKDGTDLIDPSKNFFMHNIEENDYKVSPPGLAFSKISQMRDVANVSSFWSVQVIAAYEGPVNQDFDDPQPEGALLGATSPVLVYRQIGLAPCDAMV